VAIQGFGNVGGIAARLFAEAGARVVAVSDSRGGVANEDGLDPVAVAAHKKKTGSVVGTPGTHPISNEDLLAWECDVLVPAALEHQLRCDNAVAVRAKLVVEAANGPTTPAADRMLYERGIPVLPDILANSGGVCVSYFEWVQNNENEQWDVDGVNSKLRLKMERAADAVLDKQAALNRQFPHDPVDLRTSALVVAIERVANVAVERGIWP
jgi:glutamate dehydrogenase (NAD(P)+)